MRERDGEKFFMNFHGKRYRQREIKIENEIDWEREEIN